jgi:DNA polymerase III sliding clamp (beta) subunit (PCNA family)
LKISMSVSNLKEIFKACKSYVSKDDFRPLFKAIQLTCANGICKAIALDGYKVMTIQVPYDGDEGTMLIPVIKPPKGTQVIISDTESEIMFDFLTEKQVVKKFEFEGDFLDVKKFFREDEPKFIIGFDPKILKDALDGFTGDTCIEVDFFGKTDGIIIKNSIDKQALVLPARLRNN